MQKSHEMYKKILPPNHPSLAEPYNSVGVILQRLGKHQEALENQKEALEIWKKTLPPNHPHVALGYGNVGTGLGNLGKNQEAVEHIKQALNILAAQKKHPNHELFLRNFILFLNKQSNSQQCEKAKLEILALYTEKLGKDHELIKELNKACPKGWW
jgi:tetratricopeptide (TPR) repeat protein